MIINQTLAREIYGAVAWHMDANSYVVLRNVLQDARNATIFNDVKNNTPYFAECSTNNKIVTRDWELDNKDNFNAVAVIKIDGAITNSGGASTYGMLELSSMMLKMSQDERVKGFIIYGNSGGGSSIAVETMGDAITEVRKTKRVLSLVEKGGTSASAMYMIHSYAEAIFAESEMSIVGSNGTMIQFEGIPANKEIDGVKNIRLYATKSIKKNEPFEEAVNNDNYEVIVNEMLDPINERALERVLNNRPQLKGSGFDTGKVVFAKDGIGSYIDGIASFSDVVNMILNPVNQSLNPYNKGKINTNSNNSKTSNVMTLEQLKSEHPAVFTEAFNAGVNSERDRVGAWMAHNETDSKAVSEGINSGKAISATDTQKFIIKSSSDALLKTMAQNSPPAATTPESTTNVAPENGNAPETTKEKKEAEQLWGDAFKI